VRDAITNSYSYANSNPAAYTYAAGYSDIETSSDPTSSPVRKVTISQK
jgi:hypothetical protein